jgi:hypothetical protein
MLTLHHHDALSEDGSLPNNPDRGGSARVADLRIFSAKAAWTGKACLQDLQDWSTHAGSRQHGYKEHGL